jgi:hypothetical protein
MGNDTGPTVKRVGHDEPPKVAVIFPGLRPGFALFGTIPYCEDQITEALRKLADMKVGLGVDARVAELENEGDL